MTPELLLMFGAAPSGAVPLQMSCVWSGEEKAAICWSAGGITTRGRGDEERWKKKGGREEVLLSG